MPSPYGFVLALALCCGFGNRKSGSKIKNRDQEILEVEGLGSLVARTDRNASRDAQPAEAEPEMIGKEAVEKNGCQMEELTAEHVTSLKNIARNCVLFQDLMQTDIFKMLQFRDVAPEDFFKGEAKFDDSFNASVCKNCQQNLVSALPRIIVSVTGADVAIGHWIGQGLPPEVISGIRILFKSGFAKAYRNLSHALKVGATMAEIFEWRAQALRKEREDLRENKANTITEYLLKNPIGYLWEAYRNIETKDKASKIFGRPLLKRETQTFASVDHFTKYTEAADGKEKKKLGGKKLKGDERPIFVSWRGELKQAKEISEKNGKKNTKTYNLIKVYFGEMDAPYVSKVSLEEESPFLEWRHGPHGILYAGKTGPTGYAWVKEDDLHLQGWFKYDPGLVDEAKNWFGAAPGRIYPCCRLDPELRELQKDLLKLEIELYENRERPDQKKVNTFKRLNGVGNESIAHKCLNLLKKEEYKDSKREYKSSISGFSTRVSVDQRVEPGDVVMFNAARALDHDETLWEWELADGRGCMRVRKNDLVGPLDKERLQKIAEGKEKLKETTLESGKKIIAAGAVYNSNTLFACRLAFNLGMGIAGFFTGGATWVIQGAVNLADTVVDNALKLKGSPLRSNAFALFMDSLYNREHSLFKISEQTTSSSKFCSLVQLPEENKVTLMSVLGAVKVSPCPDSQKSESETRMNDPENEESFQQYCLRYGAFVPGLPLRMKQGTFETIETLTAKPFESVHDLPKGDGKFGVLGVCVPRRRIASILHQPCIVDADCLSDYCHLSWTQIGGTCEQPCLLSSNGCITISEKHVFGHCEGGDEPGEYEIIDDVVVFEVKEVKNKKKAQPLNKTLTKGQEVIVTEVTSTHSNRGVASVVGKIKEGESHFISLLDYSSCHRFAKKIWREGDKVVLNQDLSLLAKVPKVPGVLPKAQRVILVKGTQGTIKGLSRKAVRIDFPENGKERVVYLEKDRDQVLTKANQKKSNSPIPKLLFG